jgi:sulfur relay (sulfurtransferase) complex TusBCD TusD component (DsrE family)
MGYKSEKINLKEDKMSKTFTLLLGTSPYSYENTLTTVKIAESALNKGYTVNVIASGDGVYCFLKGQKAKGITNAEEKFTELIEKGLRVYL